MLHRLTLLPIFMLVVANATAEDAPAPKLDDGLRKELLVMYKADQEARFKVIELMKQGVKIEKGKPALAESETMAELDQKHTKRMKEIVDKHGWPGQSLVGKEAANAAWLLVQHADHDRAFQKKCLPLLEAAVKKKEATGQQFAYLTDRVLCGEDKKQRYGTQLKEVDGKYVPLPLEDEAKVDKLRAEVRLQPLAEYVKLATESYKCKPLDKK